MILSLAGHIGWEIKDMNNVILPWYLYEQFIIHCNY